MVRLTSDCPSASAYFFDGSPFKNHKFKAINISIDFTSFVTMIGVFRAIFFQTVLGYTPRQLGLITFTSTLPIFFVTFIAGMLSDRLGPKVPFSIGFSLLILSLIGLGINCLLSKAYLISDLILFGTGLSFIFTPSFSAALKSLLPSNIGVGMGIITTLQMFAGTFGIALIGFFLSRVESHYTVKRIGDIANFSLIHYVLSGIVVVAFILTMIFYCSRLI